MNERENTTNATLTDTTFARGHEYAIELRQREVAILGEHNYWVLKDVTTGQDIAEVHGLPVDEKGQAVNEHKATTKTGGSFLGFVQRDVRSEGPYYKDQEPVTATLRVTGPAEEILHRWNDGLASLRHFNAQRFGYDFMGGRQGALYANSNVAAYSFGRALGIPPADLTKANRGTGQTDPGWGRDLHEERPGAPRSGPWRSSKDGPLDGIQIRNLWPETMRDKIFRNIEGQGASLDSRDGTVRFAGRRAPRAAPQDILADAGALIRSDDYWRNPRKQARVAAIFKTLYPA